MDKLSQARTEFTGEIRMSPEKFYSLVKQIKDVGPDKIEELNDFIEQFEGFTKSIDLDKGILQSAIFHMFQEIQASTKVNPLASFQEQEQATDQFEHSLGKDNFLYVTFHIIELYSKICNKLLCIAEDLKPQPLMVSNYNPSAELTTERIQNIMFETQLNGPAVQRFLTAISGLDDAKFGLVEAAKSIGNYLDNYYRALLNRHEVQGIKVHRDPIITDVAMSVFENIDAHGEIQSGKKASELSAYSMRKAEIIVETLRKGYIAEFIKDPESFINFVVDSLNNIWIKISNLVAMFHKTIEDIYRISGIRQALRRTASQAELEREIVQIMGANPNSVREKESTAMLSTEDRHDLEFKNETLGGLVLLLQHSSFKVKDVIMFVLERKEKLEKFYKEENSFYVCKIGAGNSFLGVAPGALQVVPGIRPTGKFDEIIGSNINEVKEFIKSIEMAAKWGDLFIATSPSRSADKSNGLLVGPPGCGKSEILRAIANDSDSIGVYANGSDFLTCWKGESSKNPKRLFEAAIKLKKETNKHVHILIDEIDSVLKKKEFMTYSEDDLSLEFQMLMDGVVNYAGISVWGTTNFPERIPDAMLRRFSLVKIVGELDQTDRIKLLKHFVEYFLPTEDFEEDDWENVAKRLDGATGDVIRKMADHVWRTKISAFVNSNNEEADKIVGSLNKDGKKFDVRKFSDEQRVEFKNSIRKHVSITPKDINKSVDIHLNNVAVRAEIDSAVRAYARSRAFINQLGGLN